MNISDWSIVHLTLAKIKKSNKNTYIRKWVLNYSNHQEVTTSIFWGHTEGEQICRRMRGCFQTVPVCGDQLGC